jgi:hypothetical protein
MAEYISRKSFIERVKDIPFWGSVAVLIAEQLPAADVRPVVLCKDCKHRFMKPNGWHCPYAEWGIEDDDFCSCGEKREES